MKFKIGDKVKQTKDCKVYPFYKNSIGKIIKVDKDGYDYMVSYKNRKNSPCFYFENELELRKNSNIVFIQKEE
jgi:hypothetical protein